MSHQPWRDQTADVTVLLHNGGFSNGCITKGISFLLIRKPITQKMIKKLDFVFEEDEKRERWRKMKRKKR